MAGYQATIIHPHEEGHVCCSLTGLRGMVSGVGLVADGEPRFQSLVWGADRRQDSGIVISYRITRLTVPFGWPLHLYISDLKWQPPFRRCGDVEMWR